MNDEMCQATAYRSTPGRGMACRDDERDLFAPILLRSQVLALLHTETVAGTMPAEEALALADRACRWADTYGAEYVALTRLHAIALVTADEELRQAAEGIVPITTVEGFLAPQR